MDTSEYAEHAQMRVNEAGVLFVMTELDTGLMFCSMASKGVDELDARRNLARARHSYESALDHVARLVLNASELKLFEEKKMRIRLFLVGFGFAY